jgi:hypothetical protein
MSPWGSDKIEDSRNLSGLCDCRCQFDRLDDRRVVILRLVDPGRNRPTRRAAVSFAAGSNCAIGNLSRMITCNLTSPRGLLKRRSDPWPLTRFHLCIEAMCGPSTAFPHWMYRPSMRNPAILGHSAVLLFIATTRALQSDFAPHKENLPAIAAICRRLDGIPLAIDFAATRVATRSPEH